jgi:hypothetical protein
VHNRTLGGRPVAALIVVNFKFFNRADSPRSTRVERDQNFASVHGGHRKDMERQHVGSPKRSIAAVRMASGMRMALVLGSGQRDG